jgi:hypothetical protein
MEKNCAPSTPWLLDNRGAKTGRGYFTAKQERLLQAGIIRIKWMEWFSGVTHPKLCIWREKDLILFGMGTHVRNTASESQLIMKQKNATYIRPIPKSKASNYVFYW